MTAVPQHRSVDYLISASVSEGLFDRAPDGYDPRSPLDPFHLTKIPTQTHPPSREERMPENHEAFFSSVDRARGECRSPSESGEAAGGAGGSSGSSRTPKTIHFVWVQNPFKRADFRRNLELWRREMPDFTMVLWVDQDEDPEVREWARSNMIKLVMIPEVFGGEDFPLEDLYYRELTTPIPDPGRLSDFLRYSLLKAFGGYYSDVDITPFETTADLKSPSMTEGAGEYKSSFGRMTPRIDLLWNPGPHLPSPMLDEIFRVIKRNYDKPTRFDRKYNIGHYPIISNLLKSGPNAVNPVVRMKCRQKLKMSFVGTPSLSWTPYVLKPRMKRSTDHLVKSIISELLRELDHRIDELDFYQFDKLLDQTEDRDEILGQVVQFFKENPSLIRRVTKIYTKDRWIYSQLKKPTDWNNTEKEAEHENFELCYAAYYGDAKSTNRLLEESDPLRKPQGIYPHPLACAMISGQDETFQLLFKKALLDNRDRLGESLISKVDVGYAIGERVDRLLWAPSDWRTGLIPTLIAENLPELRKWLYPEIPLCNGHLESALAISNLDGHVRLDSNPLEEMPWVESKDLYNVAIGLGSIAPSKWTPESEKPHPLKKSHYPLFENISRFEPETFRRLLTIPIGETPVRDYHVKAGNRYIVAIIDEFLEREG